MRLSRENRPGDIMYRIFRFFIELFCTKRLPNVLQDLVNILLLSMPSTLLCIAGLHARILARSHLHHCPWHITGIQGSSFSRLHAAQQISKGQPSAVALIVVLKGFSKKGAGRRRPYWNGITLLSNPLIFLGCSYYVDVSSMWAGTRAPVERWTAHG